MNQAENEGTFPCRVGQFSPEFQLACACCRVSPTPEDNAKIKRLLGQVDVQRFLELVISRHRIAPLVHDKLSRIDAGHLPAGLLEPLSAAVRANTIKALRAARTLLRINQWFAQASINWLPFKGITLAQRYYGEIKFRHVNDQDIWVPVHKLEEARAVLGEHGFNWLSAMTNWDLAERGPRHHRFLINYYFEEQHRSAEDGRIELHWRLTENQHLFRLSPQQMLARRDRLRLGGADLPVMNSVDLLLYLCEHGGRHCWYRLKWLADLPQVLESQAWDWPAVLTQADQVGCRRSLLLGLSLARDLFAWKPAPEVEAAWRSMDSLRMLQSTVRAGLEAPGSWWEHSDAGPDRWIWRQQLARVALMSSWRAAVTQGLRFAMSPNDMRIGALPDRLLPLYILLRPILFAWRRWLAWRHRPQPH
jgi:hypothetical protein